MKKITQFKSLVASVVVAVGLAPIMPLTALAAPVDSVAPTVSITSPSNGSTVSGNVNVSANASDIFSNCVVTLFSSQFDVTPLQTGHPGGNIFTCGTDMTTVYQGMHGTNLTRMNPYAIPTSYAGVTKVELYIDGVLSGTDTASPYSYSWNTLAVSNGSHAIYAKAYDGTNTKNSATINVTVNNSVTTPAPTVSITSPVNNSTVSGTIAIAASATGSPAVNKVEFYLDGTLLFSDTVSPYSFNWNTASSSNGSHALQAKVYDSSAIVGNSTLVNVNVLNSSTTTTTTSTPPSCRKHHDDDDDDDDEDGEEREHERFEKSRKNRNNPELQNQIKSRREEIKKLLKMVREGSDD